MENIITVIGSSTVEMIISMETLPLLGQRISTTAHVQTYGGKGANQAVSVARAGGNVYFVNCVSDDIFALPIIESFKNDKINTRFIFREKEISPGTALVTVGEQDTNYLSVALGANNRLTTDHINEAISSIGLAEIIIIQNEILVESNEYIINIASDIKKKVIYNFAPARMIDTGLLGKIWMLVINETEVEFLTGIPASSDKNIELAAQKLFEMGPENVIITLGAKGSYIYSCQIKMMISLNEVEVTDHACISDVYCGSLAVALVEGKSLAESVRFAHAASAICSTRKEAQYSAPFRDEIDTYLCSLPIQW
jgi:ribokinase